MGVGESDSNPESFHGSRISEEDGEAVNVFLLTLPHVMSHDYKWLLLSREINVVLLPDLINLCLDLQLEIIEGLGLYSVKFPLAHMLIIF